MVGRLIFLPVDLGGNSLCKLYYKTTALQFCSWSENLFKKEEISGHFKLDSPYTPSVTEITQKLPNDLSFPKHYV